MVAAICLVGINAIFKWLLFSSCSTKLERAGLNNTSPSFEPFKTLPQPLSHIWPGSMSNAATEVRTAGAAPEVCFQVW